MQVDSKHTSTLLCNAVFIHMQVTFVGAQVDSRMADSKQFCCPKLTSDASVIEQTYCAGRQLGNDRIESF